MARSFIRYNAVVSDFVVPERLGVLMEEPKKRRSPRPSKKLSVQKRKREGKSNYPMIHVDQRHGDAWPRKAGWRGCWTGWLTYREYNIIDFCQRLGHSDMAEVGKYLGHNSPNSTERAFYNLVEAGVIEGTQENFTVTPMAKILFNMTDQFIMQLDLDHEDE